MIRKIIAIILMGALVTGCATMDPPTANVGPVEIELQVEAEPAPDWRFTVNGFGLSESAWNWTVEKVKESPGFLKTVIIKAAEKIRAVGD